MYIYNKGTEKVSNLLKNECGAKLSVKNLQSNSIIELCHLTQLDSVHKSKTKRILIRSLVSKVFVLAAGWKAVNSTGRTRK